MRPVKLKTTKAELDRLYEAYHQRGKPGVAEVPKTAFFHLLQDHQAMIKTFQHDVIAPEGR